MAANSPSTLRDVARLAGVSVSTASQALRNRPNVAPETRERVLEVAATLGYQQQIRIAQTMTTTLSVVGVLTRTTPDMPMLTNPFYSHVITGIERECQRLGISMMYANMEADTLNRPLMFPPMLQGNQVDGLLIVGALLPEVIAELHDRPVVLVDAYAPGQPIDSVVSDNFNGAYAAVSYLIEQGHRNIGLIGTMEDAYPSIRERRDGYLSALRGHGIAQTFIENSELSRTATYAATRRLLERCPEITAIFAVADLAALETLRAAESMGLAVPDQLSIVGFDDIDLTREVRPQLTSVHVDKALMGMMSVRLLRERAEAMSRTTMTVTLHTQLIIRDSVRRPRA